jgi:hypothetical protein
MKVTSNTLHSEHLMYNYSNQHISPQGVRITPFCCAISPIYVDEIFG